MEEKVVVDKLVVLSIAIKTVYRNLLKDAEEGKTDDNTENKRGSILSHIEGIMNKPVIKLKSIHDNFLVGVSKDQDLFDRWVSIQLQVITLLGEDIGALNQLCKTIEIVMASCNTTAEYDVKEADLYKSTSFCVLAGFRVYLDDISQADVVSGNFPSLIREAPNE